MEHLPLCPPLYKICLFNENEESKSIRKTKRKRKEGKVLMVLPFTTLLPSLIIYFLKYLYIHAYAWLDRFYLKALQGKRRDRYIGLPSIIYFPNGHSGKASPVWNQELGGPSGSLTSVQRPRNWGSLLPSEAISRNVDWGAGTATRTQTSI